jgi:hypothetical protein
MRYLLIPATLALLACGQKSYADKPAPPSTYKVLSADEKFVFVMIAPEPLADELGRYNDDHKKVVKAIRDVYAKSGLYKNDGSKDPLWTVDWYAHGVSVASDGVHLVRFGPWPSMEEQGKNRKITKGDLAQKAFTVYAKGKEIHSFAIGDLVDDATKLPMTASHFTWHKDSRIDDGKGQFAVTTLDGNRFLVELATGKIVEKKKAP